MLIAILVFWICWAVIVYTYIVFPLILAIFAKFSNNRGSSSLKSGSVDQNSQLPRVALVVAAYNEERHIRAKLANAWEIDYPAEKLQLWIGSDGSSDNTNSLLSACSDPRLHAFPFEERRGKISVLNDLMREIDADIIVMSDANTMLSPDAVKLLVAQFRDERVGCVSGEVVLEQNGGVSGEGLYWKYEGWIKRCESKLGFLIGCNGGLFALRGSLYNPLPSSTIVEDFVITMRVLEQGYQVRFEPGARGTEPACESAKAEMIRKIRIGAGGFQALGLTGSLLLPRFGLIAFAYWGHKLLRWLVPFCFVSALLANAVLRPLGVFYQISLAVQLLGFGFGALAYYSPAGKSLPKIVRPIGYFYLMNYALFCGFFRFLFRTQRVTWDRAIPSELVQASVSVYQAPSLAWKDSTNRELVD